MANTSYSSVCFESLITRIEGMGYMVETLDEHGILDGGLQDIVVYEPNDPSRKVIVSYRLQSSNGSAELKLSQAVLDRESLLNNRSDIARCIFVLEGDGWSDRARSLYLEGGLITQLNSLMWRAARTEITDFNTFSNMIRTENLIPAALKAKTEIGCTSSKTKTTVASR